MQRVVIILSILFCFSCKEISFREPQPTGKKQLTAIPKNLHGRYLTYQDNGELSKDTIVVDAKGYRFGYFDRVERAASASEYDLGILSDSLILKSYKGYYFLNFNERPEWLLRVIRQKKNGDLVYMAPEQEGVDFKIYLEKISKELQVDSVQLKDKTIYQINPTPQQLIKLVESGYFSQAILKKIQP
jgi:hypothetical protein